MDQFADSSLNIMVLLLYQNHGMAEWLAAQQDVYLKIIDILQSQARTLPSPARRCIWITLHRGTGG
ncbi:hypothetical protein ACNKHL_10915 [Shigella flexneri]